MPPSSLMRMAAEDIVADHEMSCALQGASNALHVAAPARSLSASFTTSRGMPMPLLGAAPHEFLPPPYREIRIGPFESGRDLLYSTVLLVPSLLSKVECEELMAAADMHLTSTPPRACQMHRLSVAEFACERARHLVRELFFVRVLGLLETRAPEVARAAFGTCHDLASLPCKFTGVEPSINVYHAGGQFDPHQDHEALTVLSVLSPSAGAFEGGGTAFWPESQTYGQWLAPVDVERYIKRGSEVVLKPEQGDVLLWGGNLPHAGLPVISGTRHVLVGSFSLGGKRPDYV